MLKVPSELRYHPSNAGVTVWPLDLATATGKHYFYITMVERVPSRVIEPEHGRS